MAEIKSPLRFKFLLTEEAEGVFKDAEDFPETVVIDDDRFDEIMRNNKFVNRSLKF